MVDYPIKIIIFLNYSMIQQSFFPGLPHWPKNPWHICLFTLYIYIANGIKCTVDGFSSFVKTLNKSIFMYTVSKGNAEQIKPTSNKTQAMPLFWVGQHWSHNRICSAVFLRSVIVINIKWILFTIPKIFLTNASWVE